MSRIDVIVLLRGDCGIVNIRIKKNIFLTYLFHFLLAFSTPQILLKSKI
jgi:hypothetical protein